MDSFKDYMRSEEQKTTEGATDTGQVAHFARPIGYFERPEIDPFFRKKKSKVRTNGKSM